MLGEENIGGVGDAKNGDFKDAWGHVLGLGEMCYWERGMNMACARRGWVRRRLKRNDLKGKESQCGFCVVRKRLKRMREERRAKV